MKRFIKITTSLIFICLCFCCIIPSTGCKKNNVDGESDDGWIEVQSITYIIGSEKTTYASTYQYKTTTERINQTEYDNAPIEYKATAPFVYDFSSRNKMSSDRADFITNANKLLNNPRYYCITEYDTPYYIKVIFNSYEIDYVKIKFNNENNIDLSFDNKIINILPTAYEITYFND